jgi:hypothetical protein
MTAEAPQMANPGACGEELLESEDIPLISVYILSLDFDYCKCLCLSKAIHPNNKNYSHLNMSAANISICTIPQPYQGYFPSLYTNACPISEMQSQTLTAAECFDDKENISGLSHMPDFLHP